MREITKAMTIREATIANHTAPPPARRRPDATVIGGIDPVPMIGKIDPAPAREAIAVRAYELFLERGGADGDDLGDWLRAERELRGVAEAPTIES